MRHTDDGIERLIASFRDDFPADVAPAGLNEARWPDAIRRRVVRAPVPVAHLHTRLEHAWVLSVTALAGQRRAG